jgi:hypothetical protein
MVNRPDPPIGGSPLLDEIKNHAREYLMVVAVALALVQIILPSFLDLVFDFMLVGCVYLASKIGGKR